MTYDEAKEAYEEVENKINDIRIGEKRAGLYVSQRETIKGDYYLVIRMLGVPVSPLQREVSNDDAHMEV